MAVGVGDAFGEGGLLFALAYAVVRLIGLGIYLCVSAGQPDQRVAVRRFSLLSLAGLALAVLGGFLAPELRVWAWLGGMFDAIAALVGGKQEGWDLHAGHFAERHGLFVIIALAASVLGLFLLPSPTPIWVLGVTVLGLAALLVVELERCTEALHEPIG